MSLALWWSFLPSGCTSVSLFAITFETCAAQGVVFGGGSASIEHPQRLEDLHEQGCDVVERADRLA